MQFELTEEQKALRETIQSLLTEHAEPRDAFSSNARPGTQSLWKHLADVGVTDLGLDRDSDRLGYALELAIIAEQVGQTVAPAPFSAAAVANVLLHGTDADLPAGLNSNSIAVAVLPDLTPAPPIAASIAASAATLDGVAPVVPGLVWAEYAVVVTDEVVALVDLSTDGVDVVAEPALDPTLGIGALRLSATPAVVVATGNDAADRHRDALRLATTLTSAEAAGVAAKALEISAAYARTRHQFGKPIGSFQAIKHKLADMLIKTENARSGYVGAAATLSGQRTGLALDESVAMAKVAASDAATHVTAEALQIHGGIGNTFEADVHLYLRRAQSCRALYGSSADHLARIADSLIDGTLLEPATSADLPDNAEEFTAELSTWLDENLPEGFGEPGFRMPKGTEPRREFIRDLQRTMAEGRWLAIHWPEEFGGRNATMEQQIAYHAELARRGVPRPLGHIGLNLCGPTIIRHGTDEQRSRFLDAMRRGEEIWCEGFSEPEAGSDLAGIRTRGVIDGDELVINGQKIWTTGAHYSEWMFALVRTDPSASKHDGLSFVLIPMDAPGITVRPIERISRDPDINEVFLDNVRVPLSNVVGPLHGGWGVTRTTLSHERYTQFLASQIGFTRVLSGVVRLAKDADLLGKRPADEFDVRNALARKWMTSQLIRVNGLRNIATVKDSGEPGPEGAIMKVFGQEEEKALYDLALAMHGSRSLLDRGAEFAVDRGKWVFGYLRTRASTIAGGTSEIQRNIIAERVLGMPRS